MISFSRDKLKKEHPEVYDQVKDVSGNSDIDRFSGVKFDIKGKPYELKFFSGMMFYFELDFTKPKADVGEMEPPKPKRVRPPSMLDKPMSDQEMMHFLRSHGTDEPRSKGEYGAVYEYPPEDFDEMGNLIKTENEINWLMRGDSSFLTELTDKDYASGHDYQPVHGARYNVVFHAGKECGQLVNGGMNIEKAVAKCSRMLKLDLKSDREALMMFRDGMRSVMTA